MKTLCLLLIIVCLVAWIAGCKGIDDGCKDKPDVPSGYFLASEPIKDGDSEARVYVNDKGEKRFFYKTDGCW